MGESQQEWVISSGCYFDDMWSTSPSHYASKVLTNHQNDIKINIHNIIIHHHT